MSLKVAEVSPATGQLHPLPRKLFIQYVLGTTRFRRSNRLHPHPELDLIERLLEVSMNIKKVVESQTHAFLHIGYQRRFHNLPAFLIDFNINASNRLYGIDVPRDKLVELLKRMRFYVTHFKYIPPLAVHDVSLRIDPKSIDSTFYSFSHLVKKTTLESVRGRFEVARFPGIFNQRTELMPHFYSGIMDTLNLSSESYVYLPLLFLKTDFKTCMDAEFRVMVLDEDPDSPPRIIHSMKQDASSEDSITEIMVGDNYDHIKHCEGLSFGPYGKLEDEHDSRLSAFKLSDDHVRILIAIKCAENGACLVDRAVQTARLYVSILAELPTLKHFDVAVLVNASRALGQSGLRFSFDNTIIGKIKERGRNPAMPVSSLKAVRPDLSWFTNYCNPRAAYQCLAYDFYPQKRCLWIVDANPPLTHINDLPI